MSKALEGGRAGHLKGRSTAELVKQAAEQISLLVRDELRLARAELQEKGKHAGIGIGMFGGAGMFVFFGVAIALAAAVLALAIVWPPWLAALVVAAALLLIGGILALI